MLDRALGKTFANLSTLLLLACVFTLPIHLVHAYVFKEALAVAEIGPEIRAFPEGRQVRGVAKEDLDGERKALLIVLGIEVLLLPAAYRATRRVIEVSDEGGVATVIDAWTHLRSTARSEVSQGPVAVAAVVGLVGAWLVWMIGNLLSDMVSADLTWALTGLTRAFSVALFTAIACGVAACLPGARTQTAPVEKLDLY